MKLYCIKQHDILDCGDACIAIISKQYGRATSISKIREIAGTDKMGTNAYGMVKVAEQRGVRCLRVLSRWEQSFYYNRNCK